jgi:FkbM family methyltransferase
VTSFANRISERFSKNDKIQVFPYGLGGATRMEQIYIAADGSSLFKKLGNREDVEIVDVKDWIEGNLKDHQHIDLMKINIEGGEYELLDRLIEMQLIDMINNIQVQFHQVSHSSLSHMNRIQSDLMNTHEPTYQYEFVWENWRRKNTG